MHIAAYMAACDADDLDGMARNGLRAVAGRANRSGYCWASIGRLAQDMGCHYKTAWEALGRAVTAGYLTVDKSCGKPSVWRLTYVTASQDLCSDAIGPMVLGHTKDLMDKNDGEASAPAHGENHHHPRGCECRGTGWVEIEDQVVGGLMVARCPAKLTIVDG